MNDRLRALREKMGLSRAAFGQRIGVSGDVVNNLERGRVEIKDHIVKLICSEFSINEEWLRNGAGEMFLRTPDSILEQLKKEFNLDDFSYNLVYNYLKLNEQNRKSIRDFLTNVINSPTQDSKNILELKAAHNDHIDDEGETEKIQRDIALLKHQK